MQTIFLRTVSQVAEALHEDAHWLSEEEDDDALFDDVRSDVMTPNFHLFAINTICS